MNQCEACHQPGPAPAKPPSSLKEASVFRVSARFSHLEHASKAQARGVGTVCASCHVGLGAQEPPGRPTMQSCEGCHDGKSAFDARGTQCGKCHVRQGPVPAAMPAPERPFRHGPHSQLGVNLASCTSCHGIGMDWKAVQAGRNQHQPCQSCHAAEFRLVGQPICLSCHERNDPFAPNPLRPPAPLESEWRLGEIPHPPHLSAGVPCATCHAEQAGQGAQGINGHPLCGQCHKEGSRITLADCQRCHVWRATPRQAAGRRPFSTRARFRHDEAHRAERCESCHHTAGAADLTPPTMAGCADRCHDGKTAFKVTGFQCVRCHGPRTQP
jgi:hypothetical protein